MGCRERNKEIGRCAEEAEGRERYWEKDNQEQTEGNAGKVQGLCKSMIGLKREENREKRENVG